jgi:tetratricopeptide (TPR) repeat protein
MSAADRARIQFQAASLRNDFAGRERALSELVKANPGDAESWRALGDTAYVRHDYKVAVEAYQRALQSQPDDPSILNTLGYSFAFSGDIDNALRILQHYRSVRPNDSNPLDSAGDVNLMYGRLREAENLYLQADKKDRSVLAGGDLLKASFARLMTGDVAGASALANQYADARTAMKDPAAPVIPAEWQWISGDRKGAISRLQTFAAGANPATDREAVSRACYDLAFWSLLEDDRAAAKRWAAKSGVTATQSTAAYAMVSQFLAQPAASPAEWSARAGQLFRNAPQSEIAGLTLAYALLLDRRFDAAANTLRAVYDGPSVDPGVPVLLAWSLIETGHPEEAAPLLRFNPIPAPAGISPYMGFYFPRLFDLRARLAEKSGRSDEAAANRLLYKKLM